LPDGPTAVDWSLLRDLQQVRSHLHGRLTQWHIPVIPTTCLPLPYLSLQGRHPKFQLCPCWFGRSLSCRANHFSGYPAAVDPRTTYDPTTGTYQPMPVAQNIADTSNIMVVPYGTAPVPTTYTHYQNPHYVNISAAQQYCQSVMYDTAAPVYTNGHQVTTPQCSHHPSNRPQVNRAPLVPTGTPNRTVFLSRLPYTAASQVVRHLLEEFGTIEHCDVPLDRTSPSQIQGTAIVRFNESNDAARAIKNLNGTKWKGVTISARWDRESAGTRSGSSIPGRPPRVSQGSPGAGTNAEARREDGEARDQRRRASDGPLIVNGSRGNVAPSRGRRGSRQGGSDSSEYDGDGEDDSSSDGTSP
jgi:hypothetical protein